MFKLRTLILTLVTAICLLSFASMDGVANTVEAARLIVTSTPTPTNTPIPTITPTETRKQAVFTHTATPTITPTPCPEAMGCAGIAPTLSQTTSTSLLMLIVGILLLLVYGIVHTVAGTKRHS